MGYRRRTDRYGKPAVVAENQLEQNFDVEAPNQVCVTDIWVAERGYADGARASTIENDIEIIPLGSPYQLAIIRTAPVSAMERFFG